MTRKQKESCFPYMRFILNHRIAKFYSHSGPSGPSLGGSSVFVFRGGASTTTSSYDAMIRGEFGIEKNKISYQWGCVCIF